MFWIDRALSRSEPSFSTLSHCRCLLHVAGAEFCQRRQNDTAPVGVGLFQRDGHALDKFVDGCTLGIGDVEFLQHRRGATVHANHYGHRLALVGATLDARIGLRTQELLRHVSKLYRGLVQVGIDPVTRRLVCDKAGDAFEALVRTVELRQPTDKGVEPEVAGKLPDVLGARAQFRE